MALFGSLRLQATSGLLSRIPVDRLEIKGVCRGSGHELFLSLSLIQPQQCRGLGYTEHRTRTLLHLIPLLSPLAVFYSCLLISAWSWLAVTETERQISRYRLLATSPPCANPFARIKLLCQACISGLGSSELTARAISTLYFKIQNAACNNKERIKPIKRLLISACRFCLTDCFCPLCCSAGRSGA